MTTREPEVKTRHSYGGDRRPINTDPREHPSASINPDPRQPVQWTAGSYAGMAPPRQQHKRWQWFVISLVLLAVILGGLVFAAFRLTHTITLVPQRFAVGAQPVLVLTASSADVHISSGPANQISVQGTERTSAWSNDPIPLNIQQNGDTITVSVQEQPTFNIGLFYQSLEIDVTVPSQTRLDVTTDSGNITSGEGVTGQMKLTTGSGDITTNGGSGEIALSTDSGDIHASTISGQMTMTTSSGSITASNASASGASTFQTDSGDIHFSGSLDPAGSDHFTTSSGSVDITLPSDAAMQVQASTSSGDIRSDFAGVSVVKNDSGGTAIGRTGNGPQFAQVTIQTDSGDIHLNRG